MNRRSLVLALPAVLLLVGAAHAADDDDDCVDRDDEALGDRYKRQLRRDLRDLDDLRLEPDADVSVTDQHKHRRSVHK